MSDLYVFTGPSLAADDARRELDAVYLPPVSQGDVYNAARRRPWAIGIVDGYFERVPTVWHKEILWAMSRGVHVFGSASMGALRAAELHAFGMEGVGAVFEAFHRGELEDDDEVAVVHGQAGSGYRPASEAMVNIRSTLAAARREGVISRATHDGALDAAKALYYPRRDYPAVLAACAERGLDARELAALRDWLPAGRLDQKRADALAMLRRIRELRERDPAPKRVSYSFQHTEVWEILCAQAAQRPLEVAAGADTAAPGALLDELRLLAGYPEERRRATIRVLALELAERLRLVADAEAIADAADAFRRRRRLFEPEDLKRWLGEQRLSAEGFTRLIRDEVLIARVCALGAEDIDHALRDQLRCSGGFAELDRRARDKQRLLAEHGLTNPDLEQAGMREDELWRWYFEERLGGELPADVKAYGATLGYPSLDDFRRAALRELCYLRAGT